MADIRKELTRLVLDAPKTDIVYGNIKLPKPVKTATTIVDNLIAGGVVIPVRCEKCKYAVGHDGIHKTVLCQKRSAYPKQWDDMPFDGFCSYGERRE